MKKIIGIVVLAVIVLIGVKIFSGNSVGEMVMENIETQVKLNNKAMVGTEIECPICHNHFKKGLTKNKIFDTEKCEQKYLKYLSIAEKERNFTEKASNVVMDTKDSIQENFNKE